MLIIPAIDIKDGKCVRLKQGRMDDGDDITVYGDDPVEMAGKWVEAGARRLHLVDLDGARQGAPVNHDVIRAICSAFPELPVQAGGGVRDEAGIDTCLDAGVSFVILGSRAVATPHFVTEVCAGYIGHIIIGLDAKGGRLAVDGWSKLSHHDLFDLAQQFERDGAEAIIYTDIDRDGMQTGVNVENTAALARHVNMPVIASGGLASLDDVRALCAVSDDGVSGVIAGRALYEGTFTLAEAQTLADELSPPTASTVTDEG